MTGSLLPAILTFLALGLFLARVRTWPMRGVNLALAALGAVIAYKLSFDGTKATGVYLACWGSIIATAATLYLPRGVNSKVAAVLATATGAAAGAVAGLTDAASHLALASAGALVVFPAVWLVSHNKIIAVKVAASWLIAIACLAASLSLVPTPGYEPDHME